MSDEVRARFVHHCWEFLDGAKDEAQLREDDEIPTLEKYLGIRRKSGFCPALFDLIEAFFGITLPAEIFEDENFLKIHDAANDIINGANVSKISFQHSCIQIAKALTLLAN